MLDRIHKISEIVAAFAIVGSLVFVGVQLRQNTLSMNANRMQSAMEVWNETALAVATDEKLAKRTYLDMFPVYREFPFYPGVDAQMDVENGGFRQVIMFVSAIKNTVESQYLMYLEGNQGEETWNSFKNVLAVNLTLFESYGRYWSNNKSMHSDRFQSLVDGMMIEATTRRQDYQNSVGFE